MEFGVCYFQNDLSGAEEAYNAFFCHYPYCYGYWKKYSDMEKKHGNLDKALEVNVTLCVYFCT